MIYLDHNATTPVVPEAIAAVAEGLRIEGNPSSVHRAGQGARIALERARAQVAELIEVRAREIVFTSGATEANQLAILGLQSASAGPLTIISSRAEHPSVSGTLDVAAARGATIHLLDLDESGQISLTALNAAIAGAETPHVLVSLMLVNNEVGIGYPVAEAVECAHAHGALFHTDATQAVGRVAVDGAALGADLLSFSAHKFGGPRGVGALRIRRGLTIVPPIPGGHQERGKRPGTENLSGIMGFGAAAEAAATRIQDWPRVCKLAKQLGDALVREVEGAVWLARGPDAQDTGNTCCVAFPGVPADALLMALDMRDVCVSAGSACSSGSLEPSPVLLAMGLDAALAGTAVRFSLGWGNTSQEVLRVVELVVDEVAHIRRVQQESARWAG